ncbi:MAG: glycosyltransferase family 4 protein [Nitrospinae bacterium]|nr:glycosyltransferase family 4 protein [Nitrospinota bacterium]
MTNTLFLLDLEDKYFLSHRRALALAARDAGYRVVVCVRIGGKYMERIRAEGFECLALENETKGGISFPREFQALIKLIRAYQKHRPHTAHHFGVRNLLHGSIAARFSKTPFVVNSFLGMGSLFSRGSLTLRILSKIVLFSLRRIHRAKNTRVIVQNDDDKQIVLQQVLFDESRLSVVRGSGVDVRSFHPTPEPPGAPQAVLASRMLAEKGVHEFVEAAALLKKEGAKIRMVLVGNPDPKNPTSIPESTLARWRREAGVEWWGYREDMAEVWRGCHIAVLPTYYNEGLPRSLLEAAACARPLVATEIPGCRAILTDGINGLSVLPRDARSLADAIGKLARNSDMRRSMGEAGRRIVETEFSDRIVTKKILEIYEHMDATEKESGRKKANLGSQADGK